MIKRDTKHQKGFTLIELLIVILIVSLVYFLGFEGVEFTKKRPKALTPLNLKTTITSSPWFSGNISFLCLNHCKTCLLRKGIGHPYQPYPNRIDLTNIKAYTVDASNSLQRIEYERYQDKPICLKIDFYSNGSSTPIILQNEESTYYLPAYFEDAKEFNSPEDARDYWVEKSQLVADNGEFY